MYKKENSTEKKLPKDDYLPHCVSSPSDYDLLQCLHVAYLVPKLHLLIDGQEQPQHGGDDQDGHIIVVKWICI